MAGRLQGTMSTQDVSFVDFQLAQALLIMHGDTALSALTYYCLMPLFTSLKTSGHLWTNDDSGSVDTLQNALCLLADKHVVFYITVVL